MRARRRLLGVLVLMTATVAACGHDAPRAPEAPPTEPPRPTGAETEPEEDADARLVEAVRGELLADPAVDAELVTITVDDGVVELGGQVPHLLMADAALERAAMVHGVRAVLDRMELPRSERDDAAIQRDVAQALRADPALRIAEPSVRVIEGVVTLRGKVGSFSERQQAIRIARAVRGARDVVSQLEIREVAGRSDAAILEDVRQALRADRWIDEWLLDVEVDRGVVSVRGAQPTAAAKQKISHAAWVPGVRDVDATLVRVDPELTPAQRRPPSGYTYPDDPEIRDSVRSALARDPRLGSAPIAVTVRDGHVHLGGEVPTLDARRAGAELAESVHGVWRVENDLRVRRLPRTDDEAIGRLVERALQRAAAIDAEAIEVDVRRGVVTLTGTVDSPHARTVAEDVVSRIPGVRELDNTLEPPPQRAGAIPDDVLLQNVIAHLEAHPYIDPGDVEIDVTRGEVMLRGRVVDWRAKREAIRAAHEAGAITVLDAIEVEEGPAAG